MDFRFVAVFFALNGQTVCSPSPHYPHYQLDYRLCHSTKDTSKVDTSTGIYGKCCVYAYTRLMDIWRTGVYKANGYGECALNDQQCNSAYQSSITL